MISFHKNSICLLFRFQNAQQLQQKLLIMFDFQTKSNKSFIHHYIFLSNLTQFFF